MKENIINDHSEIWEEIYKNKHREFYKILKNYKSTTDAPANFVWEKLLEDNPNAKILLTVREPDSWADSIQETILKNMLDNQPFGLKILRYFSAPMKRFDQMIKVMNDLYFPKQHDKSSLIEYYKRYVESVIEKCPKDKLLIFRVKDGWGPLCKFLNVPIPNDEFPKVNDRTEFNSQIRSWNHFGYFFSMFAIAIFISLILLISYLYKKI